MFSRVIALPLVVALGAAACGGSQPASEQETPAAGQPAPQSQQPTAPPVDPATAATISGKVTLQGTPPPNAAIRMNADPACVEAHKGSAVQARTFVVGEGNSLGNVFVYVQSGLPGSYPVPSTAVVLDQQGCMYVPHVFGVQVGQPIHILNSDATLHNVHAMPSTNREFNIAQPVKGMKTVHTFTAKEENTMVPFKCDVHGWMTSWAGVLDHPYFAVTSEDGTFEIPNLPPGTYTLAAWHERLGTQTMSVTVAEKESKTDADFTFDAAAAGAK